MQRLQSQSDDALLARARELSTAKRDHDAVRLLSVLLRRPTLTNEVKAAALRQRVTAWLGMGQERRAWRDLQAIMDQDPVDPWARLHQLRLLGRHAPAQDPASDDRLSEALAIARAHPQLALAWRVAGELARGTQRLGLSAELTLGLARADRGDVDTSCRAAVLLRRRGEADAALVLLNAVICEPDSDRAKLDRARAAAHLDRGDAVTLTTLLPQLSATSTTDALWLARAWLTIGDADRALGVLVPARPPTDDPDFVCWQLATVELHCRRGEIQAARTLFQGVPEASVPDARLVLDAAEGNWEAVAKRVDRVWTRTSSQILVAEGLRRLGGRSKDAEVRARLGRAQGTASGFFPTLLLNRAMLEPLPSLVAACIDAFRPMLSGLRPAEPASELEWLRGQADSMLSRLSGARDELLCWRDGAGTLSVSRPAPDQRHELALVRESIASVGLDGALARYQALSARLGSNPLLYTYRAEVELWAGHRQAAVQDLERALSLDPRTRWAHIGVALARLLEGEPSAALTGLDLAEAELGALSAAPAVRAEAMLRLGQLGEAEVVLIEDLRRRPTRVSTWLLLALARLRSGVDAQDIVDALAQRYPDLWQVCRGADVESRLEDALFHMRGNRSSGLITWADPRGWWRSAPARALLPKL